MAFCRVSGLCIRWFAVAQSVGLRALLWWRRPLEEAVQGELSFFFNASVGDVKHFFGMAFCRVAGLCIWWCRPLEEAVQGELSFFFNASAGDVRHFFGHGVLSCFGPVYMVACRSAIRWFEGCVMVVSSFGGGSARRVVLFL